MSANKRWFKSNDDRVPRGVAPFGVGDWDRERGNHRAVVRVSEAADAVCAYLPWRRRDTHPEAKHVMVVDAATDAVVVNAVVATCNREYGEVVFQPDSGPGEYHLYYLVPMADAHIGDWPRWAFPIYQYKRPQNAPEADWLAKHGLAGRALESTPPAGTRGQGLVFPAPWRDLPLAALVEFQARGERHSFYPMEVIATLDERCALEHRRRFRPFILFPERREHPIRMTDTLPCCWATREDDALATFADRAMRNEYFVFQVGVYASKRLLRDLAVELAPLEGPAGAVLGTDAFTCFNLGGVDQHGRKFTKSVHVEKGRIQPLWFGLDIPEDATPGSYAGRVTVSAEGEEPQSVALALTIEDRVLADRGDGDHRRLSRLRWLNSRIAQDDDVCAPFTPVAVHGNEVDILGRRIELAETGMLKQATSFIELFDIREEGRAVLREPVCFEVVAAGEAVAWREYHVSCEDARPGIARYVATATSDALDLRAEITIEMDGFIGHVVTLEAKAPAPVDAVRLRIPFRDDASGLFMHLCEPSADQVSHHTDFGETPAGEWEREIEGFELLWLGSCRAGLGLRVPPGRREWINGGKGRVTRRSSDGGRDVLLDSGPRVIDGQAVFRFELYATPFKPLTRRQWGWRHYHQSYGRDPVVEQGQAAGATVFTYHQGCPSNPYISYPFLTADTLKASADRIHEGGGLMKAYYTIRELSDRASELWALRSLGNEILSASDQAPGYDDFHLGYEDLSQLPLEYQLRNPVSWPFTGYPWLCEHLVSGYHARWHSTVDLGDRKIVDASLQITGASRWSNFYIEGMKWLMENAGLDGIYLDGITFDRESFKRVRKALVRTKPEGLIDYHSSPAAIAQMPYFDRLWFGEGADYGREAAYWLVAVSGVPFGVGGELLGGRASVQRGMVFGVSQRYGWASLRKVDPSALWRWWDEFDIAGAEMIGYWQDACPVKTDRDDVKATAYVHHGRRLAIAVASWAPEPVAVQVDLDWDAVGLDRDRATLSIPAIDFFQEGRAEVTLAALSVEPDKGWIIVVEQNG